jgi:hypothetical protein
VQYLRFALVTHDPESFREQGILTAAAEVLEDRSLPALEREAISRLCSWFNANLPVPPILGMDQHFRAVSWFTPEASDAISKMWELKALLEARGIQVQVLRTDDPGSIVHWDSLQVVAVSKRRSR